MKKIELKKIFICFWHVLCYYFFIINFGRVIFQTLYLGQEHGLVAMKHLMIFWKNIIVLQEDILYRRFQCRLPMLNTIGIKIL